MKGFGRDGARETGTLRGRHDARHKLPVVVEVLDVGDVRLLGLLGQPLDGADIGQSVDVVDGLGLLEVLEDGGTRVLELGGGGTYLCLRPSWGEMCKLGDQGDIERHVSRVVLDRRGRGEHTLSFVIIIIIIISSSSSSSPFTAADGIVASLAHWGAWVGIVAVTFMALMAFIIVLIVVSDCKKTRVSAQWRVSYTRNVSATYQWDIALTRGRRVSMSWAGRHQLHLSGCCYFTVIFSIVNIRQFWEFFGAVVTGFHGGRDHGLMNWEGLSSHDGRSGLTVEEEPSRHGLRIDSHPFQPHLHLVLEEVLDKLLVVFRAVLIVEVVMAFFADALEAVSFGLGLAPGETEGPAGPILPELVDEAALYYPLLVPACAEICDSRATTHLIRSIPGGEGDGALYAA